MRQTKRLDTPIACFTFVFTACVLASSPAFAQTEMKTRKGIGSVYTPPIEVDGKLYFLASNGALFESDKKISDPKKLFKTDKRTVSGLAYADGVFYFGEGLHEDETSKFYAFDVKKGKALFTVKMDGHVEKTPLIQGERVIVPSGQGGLVAIDRKSGKILWKKTKVGEESLHVDSSPLLIDDKVCATSIYKTKGVFCLNPEDGKEIWFTRTETSPKTDLAFSNGHIVALTTEGELMKQEGREEPTDFITLHPASGRIIGKHHTRGFNVFPQVIQGNQMFLALTTGDVIQLSIPNAELTILDQFPEPFLSSTYTVKDLFCATSTFGRTVCYRDKKRVVEMTENEVAMGQVGPAIDGARYIPTRTGYRIISEEELLKQAAKPRTPAPAASASPSAKR